MNNLSYIEELRFILELVSAEGLFVWFFAKKKANFYPKAIISIIILSLLAILYIPLIGQISKISATFGFIKNWNDIFSIIWYIMLTILSLIAIRTVYKISISDVLFLGIAGYSLQHIEFVLINEVLATGLFPQIRDNKIFYVLVCIATTAIVYAIAIKLFAERLRATESKIFEDKPSTIIFFIIMMVVMWISAFTCQDIFLGGKSGVINYKGALADFFNSLLILFVQYNMFMVHKTDREKEVVKHLLYERQRQYKLSRDNMEMINHKCHDLKHQIRALRNLNSEEVGKYVSEVEKTIEIYDSVIKTDNEVLNTILSEKSLYCEKRGIKLNCIIDTVSLDFINTLDIYTLLGNLLDNAIEGVERNVDRDKRVISFTITTRDKFLCIQTNNYCFEKLEIEDGMPKTTKENKKYHGYGMKSMKYITEKYKGALYANLNDEIFTLQIVIPIPKKQ